MKFIFVYITSPTQKEAEKIAKHLLKKRLVACANFFPVKSFYWWEGKIRNEKEFVLIGKTEEGNYQKIVKELGEIHSYSIPCIAKIPVFFNKEYGKWLRKEVDKFSFQFV